MPGSGVTLLKRRTPKDIQENPFYIRRNGEDIRRNGEETLMETRTTGHEERKTVHEPASAERSVDWRAAIWAGIIAGAVFVVLEMLMVPLFLGGSPWGPPRMIGAIVMGEGVLL